MKRQSSVWRIATLGAALLCAFAAQAQKTVPVLMLSDIHLDPYHDPAKVPLLMAAPIEKWQGILDAADTATQVADFAALQKDCAAAGVSTTWAMYKDSLHAEHAHLAKPLFVTMSGDLLGHNFKCRFEKLAPGRGDAALSEFSAKTVAFVVLELKRTFPGVPVYFALGNNDSGCEDYREDSESAFLKSSAKAFAGAMPDAKSQGRIAASFPLAGDYSVLLPAPMQRTRLIVLQDIFEALKYKQCGGTVTAEPAVAQVRWLRTQLAEAHARGEAVWVMAHIPPGISEYGTYTKKLNVCGGVAPDLFLSSDGFADALTENAAEIRLVLFGHTHQNEMRLFRGANGAVVPGKIVASISPVYKNNPSFLVAKVDPRSAVLVDYTLVAGSNATGVGTVWEERSSFSKLYALPDFSGASVAKLMEGMRADHSATSDVSQTYMREFFVGSTTVGPMTLGAAWPAYVCSMTEAKEAAFRSCSCPAVAK